MKKILIVVVVKAKLSLALIEEPEQLTPLSTVYLVTDYYGPLYPPFLTILGLTFHNRHE
jgi:hypothetical protein